MTEIAANNGAAVAEKRDVVAGAAEGDDDGEVEDDVALGLRRLYEAVEVAAEV